MTYQNNVFVNCPFDKELFDFRQRAVPIPKIHYNWSPLLMESKKEEAIKKLHQVKELL